MGLRETFVKLFTDAAKNSPSRPSVKIIDGYWTMTIKGNQPQWQEFTKAACVPPYAEQNINGDTLTLRWASIADQIFGNAGIMAKALPDYEVRLPQLHMARLIQRAIEMGEPAIIEAGTGTGKSFAYAAVAMAMNKRCVISTSNKALQAQLYQKDIPFLCKLFPGKEVALAQGKGNYLCRAKCQDKSGNIVIDNYSLIEFYKTTDTGNVEELDVHVHNPTQWTADENCNGKRCPYYADCFYYKSKADRQEADIIICNHALLLLNKLYPQANILPGCDVVVVDEAHKLADYARSTLGNEFTLDEVQRRLNEAFDILREQDLSPTATAEGYLQEFRNEIADHCIGKEGRMPVGIEHGQEFQAGQRLAQELHQIADGVWNPEDTPEDDEALRLMKKSDKIRGLADKVFTISSPTVNGYVRWIEPEPGKLINVPFDVSEFIGKMAGFETAQPITIDRTHCARCGRALTAMVHVLDGLGYGPDCIRHVDLFGDAEAIPLPTWAEQHEQTEVRHEPTAIVFTSATIAAPDLSHFMHNCGLSHGFQMVADSPFDYQSNAMLYVPNGETPQPNNPSWQTYAIEDMRKLVLSSGGGAFLLFTSWKNMDFAVKMLSDSFAKAGLKVFVQGKLPKGTIAKEFKKDGNAVLFATKSFWEGISIEGAALRLVVIDKMPFQAPSPLLKARESTVGNPFADLHVPEMIIDLKQGAGRLIRRMDDWGVIALLDSRARLMPYGRNSVLPALPQARLTCSNAEVGDFFHQRRTLSAVTLDFPVAIDQKVMDELTELGF